MNKCQNCGNPLKPGMTFCNNCGSKVEVQKETKPIDNNYGNGNNNKKKVFIIAGIVCVLVVGGLLIGGKSLMNKPQDVEAYNQSEKEDKENTNKENTNNDNKDYIIEDSSTRYLTKEELSKYSEKQLAYIRNEIFARNGYIFDTEAYSNYFYDKSWYKPNPEFSGNESELNDVEKSNVALIKKLEGNNKDESTSTSSNSSLKDKKQIYFDKLAQLEKEEESVHNEYNYGELCDADYVTETTKVYEDYDKVLNEIYQDLNATLPSDTMNDLRDIQRKWVKDKEAKQKEIEKNETGMHVNWMIIGRNGALTQMVKERCYELLNYFN